MLVNNQGKKELFQDKVYETDSYKSHSSESKGISSSGENVSQKIETKAKDVFSTEELKGEKSTKLESKCEDFPDILEEGEKDKDLLHPNNYRRAKDYSEKHVFNPRCRSIGTFFIEKDADWDVLCRALRRKNCNIRKLLIGSNRALKVLEVIDALKENTSLQKLEIRPQTLPDKVAEKLMQVITDSKNLRTLQIDHLNLSKGMLDPLIKAITHKNFPVSHLRVYIEKSDLGGVRELVQAIKQQPRIRIFETTSYPIYKKNADNHTEIDMKKKLEIAEMAKLLEGEHPLDSISIRLSPVSDYRTIYIARRLHKCMDPLIRSALACKTLKHFQIPGMDRRYCRPLLEKLRDPNCMLTYLALNLSDWCNYNDYTSKDVQQILRALQGNVSVISFDFTRCAKVKDLGNELKDLLLVNSTLRYLAVNCEVISEQYSLIAQGLKQNKNLREIRLGGDEFKNLQIKVIMEAISEHPTLARLSIALAKGCGSGGLDYYLHEIYKTPGSYLDMNANGYCHDDNRTHLRNMKLKRVGVEEKNRTKKSPMHFFRQVLNIHYNGQLSISEKDRTIRHLFKSYPKQYSNPDIHIEHHLANYFLFHAIQAPIDIAFTRGFRFRKLWWSVNPKISVSAKTFPDSFALLKISKEKKEGIRDVFALNMALLMQDRSEARRLLKPKLEKLEQRRPPEKKGCIIS